MSRSDFRWLARELRPARTARRSILRAVLGWLWRHLPEIVAVLVMLRVWSTCATAIGPMWTVVALATLMAGAMCWRRSRRWLLAGLGCVLTRYRLRAALVELRMTTLAGRLPLLLWIAPTPVGERVWLWCRVGISAEDIADEIDRIRAACVARDVRVVRDRRWAALVTVDVVRRDPLAVASVITSPLAGAARRGGSRQATGAGDD